MDESKELTELKDKLSMCEAMNIHLNALLEETRHKLFREQARKSAQKENFSTAIRMRNAAWEENKALRERNIELERKAGG